MKLIRKNTRNTRKTKAMRKDMGDVVGSGEGKKEWICHTDELTDLKAANTIERLVTIDFSFQML